jgi:transposase-like protein
MATGSVEYSEDLAQKFLGLIENGGTIISVCRAKGMPSPSRLRPWRKGEGQGVAENFPERFETALQVRLEGFVDDLIQLPRDVDIDHPGAIQQAKLECDNRRWLLSKMLRDQFGVQSKVELGGETGNALADRLVREKEEQEEASARAMESLSSEDRATLQKLAHKVIALGGVGHKSDQPQVDRGH